MKSVILMILIVISFSLGITAFLWKQPAIAIIFSIIIPLVTLYSLISDRYRNKQNTVKAKKKKEPIDNYFYPVKKE